MLTNVLSISCNAEFFYYVDCYVKYLLKQCHAEVYLIQFFEFYLVDMLFFVQLKIRVL